MVIQKRSRETSGRFYIEIKYPQSIIIIFFALITFSLIGLTNRQSANKKKRANVKLSCHSDIATSFNIMAHWDISKYLEITRRILMSIKVSKKDGDSASPILLFYVSIIQIEGVFNGSFFLLTKPSSVIQAPLLQSRKEVYKQSDLQKKIILYLDSIISSFLLIIQVIYCKSDNAVR